MTVAENTAVRRLVDRQEILDVLNRRARAADHVDVEGALSCYHSDATEDHEGFAGSPETFLREVSLTARPDSPIRMMWHFISNVIMEFDDDDAARVESYHLAAVAHVLEGEEGLSIIGGRYLDVFTRRYGRWAIQHRAVVFDWSRSEAAPVAYWTLMGHDTSKMQMGRFGADDPIYGDFGVTRGA